MIVNPPAYAAAVQPASVACLAAACLALSAPCQAAAAEVRLRSECRAVAAVVRLGDLADISSSDPQEAAALGQLELFAAPAAGRRRHVTARDIHEALALAGHDLRKVRLTGAANICVAAVERQPPERKLAPDSETALRRGRRLIDQALHDGLAVQYGISGWTLEWDRYSPAVAAVARPGALVEIVDVAPLNRAHACEADPGRGGPTSSKTMVQGTHPSAQPDDDASDAGASARKLSSIGSEQAAVATEFKVRIRVTFAGEESLYDLLVCASRLHSVVVARRTLAPGTVITPADIELAEAAPRYTTGYPVANPATSAPGSAEVLARSPASHRETLRAGPLSWDKCLGMETTRTIAAGQVLTPDALREPLLVKRGDAVTVYARSGGIVVRVTGRALESGSRGNMIAVESLDNRQRYLARVSGVQQVVVEAEPQLDGPALAGPAQPTSADRESSEPAPSPSSNQGQSRPSAAGGGRHRPRSYDVRLSAAEDSP